ncbi:hypothetical protein BYI23_E003460 (plasmid) [Burkholderia sp. YI23]|uniref:Conjugal transfer protein TraN n=1 Tax=Burkholderia vietnamiensis (strain G4 / LMG 22486) TaxID=269482 RepID=A4JTM2_BURVG|nr:conserved hypothetical protein [Burkholderia vietnamiensis G4]AET95507.1 hypothetical protein BYI23_E003460 [Burkholderia sp. YI23]MCB4350215.1 hypothetical protein [Burkholderia vietnamiensis]
MRRFLLLGALSCALALQSGLALADAHSDGLSYGKGQLDKLNGNITNNNAKNVPFYTTTPSQSSSFGGPSLFDVGVSRITSCKTATHGSDAVANQECDAVNFLAKNPDNRVKVPIGNDDPIIKGIGDTINNANGHYNDNGCVPATTTTPDQHSTEVCNEYLVTDDKLCNMGQVVEVDADSNYQCNVTKNSLYTQQCDKVLNVWCQPGQDGCDNGGIVPGSTQGDMRVWLGPIGGGTWDLQFGTFADNYWAGDKTNGAVYDRSLSFNIRDITQLTQFTLVRAAFDDWLWVQVNGITVYVGPYGGDRLYQVQTSYQASCGGKDSGMCTYYHTQIQYGPNSFGNAELGSSWNMGLNIDLRPFLHNGDNTIWTRTIVAGNGESALDIYARMYCPAVCYDSWDNQCQNLESRS